MISTLLLEKYGRMIRIYGQVILLEDMKENIGGNHETN